MARPSKPVDAQSGAMASAEALRRKENEKIVAGKNDKVSKPTMELTKAQKKIRKNIVEIIEAIASNADRYVIDQAAVAIDRLQQIEKMVNEEPDLMCDKTLQNTRKNYFSEFIRLCSELCMSPQSRAKVANAMPDSRPKNPIAEIFGDDEDE
jgi:hypothetical protein